MPIPGLPVDAIERFLKKVLKSENVFKIFGNIPDVADFFKKAVLFLEFLAIYLIKPERFQNFWQYTWCEKFFEKRVSDFGFSAYVLWWQPQKCLKEGIYEKSHDFFKGSRKKSGHSGKKLGRVKKITIFFKSGETKTGCSGEKLGRVNFFRISSKMVELNQSSRERNWAEVKNFGFLQKWW